MRCHVSYRAVTQQAGLQNNEDRRCKIFLTSSMADVDETAKLWKVNRTIHELVKDRVSCD